MSKIHTLQATVKEMESKLGRGDALDLESDCLQIDVSKVDPEDLKRVLNFEDVTRQIVGEKIDRIGNTNVPRESTVESEGNPLASKITE